MNEHVNPENNPFVLHIVIKNKNITKQEVFEALRRNIHSNRNQSLHGLVVEIDNKSVYLNRENLENFNYSEIEK